MKYLNGGLTPSQTVAELDKYIIGQDDAKRAVAIALRNRWRRQEVEDDLREEAIPKSTKITASRADEMLKKMKDSHFMKKSSPTGRSTWNVSEQDTMRREKRDNALKKKYMVLTVLVVISISIVVIFLSGNLFRLN